jgi:hypothetical protein
MIAQISWRNLLSMLRMFWEHTVIRMKNQTLTRERR